MTDLTKITTPIGLLDEKTQEALKAHGGPWQVFNSCGEWVNDPYPSFGYPSLTYRVKPQPPKPREFWINVYSEGCRFTYDTREAADSVAFDDRIACIHVREVLEDKQ